MKTLADYKREYSKAKTLQERIRAFNRAMLNLSQEDAKKFYSWRIDTMAEEEFQKMKKAYLEATKGMTKAEEEKYRKAEIERVEREVYGSKN